jgi:hypothetical protein
MIESLIPQNLQFVKHEIQTLAIQEGRAPESVRLIAVSKNHPIESIQIAWEAGQTLFGENKVQELLTKIPLLPQAEWHLIGHLQTNKVKSIVGQVALIHSVDSERLLLEIEKQASLKGIVQPILLQLFISGEETKSGLSPEEALSLLEDSNQFPHVQIKGLMGVAALTEDREIIKAQFLTLSDYFQSWKNNRPNFTELSMGMSSDFPEAIQYGSTLVRIGTAIFGSRNYA